MSVHLQRARVLLAQSRPADAERELLPALASSPENAEVHALLALCRTRQERHADALASATTAVGLAPDWPFAHYINAIVLRDLGRLNPALGAIAEAVRLDSSEADYFAVQASILLRRGDWTLALASADEALRLDPEHNNAANFRAMALVHLGRKDEAVSTVAQNLSRDPNDAFSHANQGWNALHRNDPHAAQTHFRESLRLDPSFDYARKGLLEALKARNPVYRVMLAYFLWMGRVSGKIQLALMFGVMFGNRIVIQLSHAHPGLGWFFGAVQIGLYAFVYLTWTAVAMFNLALMFDRFGRHVLSRHERRGAWIFGASVLALLGSLGWWIKWPSTGWLFPLVFAFISAFVGVSVIATGRRALVLGIVTALIALLGLASLALILQRQPEGAKLYSLFLWSPLWMLGATYLARRL